MKWQMRSSDITCVWYHNDPAGDPNGFQTGSDVGSGLIKMVTATVDAENLSG